MRVTKQFNSRLQFVVVLWRLAALNPGLAPHERDTLHEQLGAWHMKVLDKVAKSRAHPPHPPARHHSNRSHSHGPYINGISENEVFPGFHPAMEACFLEWTTTRSLESPTPRSSTRYTTALLPSSGTGTNRMRAFIRCVILLISECESNYGCMLPRNGQTAGANLIKFGI
ncbi:unnamed protein product [Plutella xylostella]|uniref:(diamondback moth) hypothetical protein n=1 Tax=Plutella xylostella TaxID=51655 RepID=A0A8S4GCY9_PLUXY|nr:unnamed protein product [Plutella xylostella]